MAARLTGQRIIHNWSNIEVDGGMVCPICGKTSCWITHAHADSHGMTRTELKKMCTPVGYLKNLWNMQKRKAAQCHGGC